MFLAHTHAHTCTHMHILSLFMINSSSVTYCARHCSESRAKAVRLYPFLCSAPKTVATATAGAITNCVGGGEQTSSRQADEHA